MNSAWQQPQVKHRTPSYDDPWASTSTQLDTLLQPSTAITLTSTGCLPARCFKGCRGCRAKKILLNLQEPTAKPDRLAEYERFQILGPRRVRTTSTQTEEPSATPSLRARQGSTQQSEPRNQEVRKEEGPSRSPRGYSSETHFHLKCMEGASISNTHWVFYSKFPVLQCTMNIANSHSQ